MIPFSFQPIGRIQSCFPEKFGIPRQPGLVPEARGTLEIISPYDQQEALRGLANFSHLWILFVFHEFYQRPWKATVRPPRLGGNQKRGVFASRSGFRPNPIGQSVVTLQGIQRKRGKLLLELGGVDLLDGTPVLDIKPYLPYVDAVPHAAAGYAPDAPPVKFEVHFAPQAEQACASLDPARYPDLKKLITGLLALDPRPAYRGNEEAQQYGMRLWDLNIRFAMKGDRISVESIETWNQPGLPLPADQGTGR